MRRLISALLVSTMITTHAAPVYAGFGIGNITGAIGDVFGGGKNAVKGSLDVLKAIKNGVEGSLEQLKQFTKMLQKPDRIEELTEYAAVRIFRAAVYEQLGIDMQMRLAASSIVFDRDIRDLLAGLYSQGGTEYRETWRSLRSAMLLYERGMDELERDRRSAAFFLSLASILNRVGIVTPWWLAVITNEIDIDRQFREAQRQAMRDMRDRIEIRREAIELERAEAREKITEDFHKNAYLRSRRLIETGGQFVRPK